MGTKAAKSDQDYLMCFYKRLYATDLSKEDTVRRNSVLKNERVYNF